MKKLSKFLKSGIISVGLFVLTISLVYFMMTEVVDVYTIRKNPTLSKGYIGVVGKVAAKDKMESFFLLEDLSIACKTIPIVYKGQRPRANTEVIVFGHFKKIENESNAAILWWEYFFEANKIKAREDIFSGNMSYRIRQEVNQLYRKCGICRKIKNKLATFPPV